MHIEIEKLVAEKPATVFWLFALAQAVLWTLVPALVNPNLPLDVIEGLAWGHEWQWGYHKHPPIKPWFIETAAVLSGRGDWAQYLLSQICIVTAFFAMWKLAEDFLRPPLALISVLLLVGIYYHNYTSPEFNVNVAQLPFWALTLLCVWRGLNRSSTPAWVLAGLFTGLGFLSKYIFLFLAFAIIAMVLMVRPFRASLKTPGPYLAAGLALAVVAPHLYWVVENDFITISYGMARVHADRGFFGNHLYYPLKFLVGQSLILIPVGIMLLTLRGGTPRPATGPDRFTRGCFILFVGFGPPLIMVTLAGIFGWKLRSMWGTPLFLISGLGLVYFLQHRLSVGRLKKFSVAWTIFFLLSLAAYGGVTLLGPAFTGRAKKTQFPGQRLALQVAEKWGKRFDQPPRTIIGDFWYAGNVAYHTPNRPSVFIDGDPRKSPWIQWAKVRARGAVVVGETRADAYGYLPEKMDGVINAGPVVLPFDYWRNLAPLKLYLLFVPPGS
jgi:4-amino-4-deoxy-L-arabinose transferase-like glycosyltransferase